MDISVLLVDDSKFVRTMLKKELPGIITNCDLCFREAENGAQALDLMSQDPFDLVFLDLTMPEMTGYQVLEKLREKKIQANIVVLTADIQPEAEKIVMDLGAMGYMKKARPLDVDSLKAILKQRGII